MNSTSYLARGNRPCAALRWKTVEVSFSNRKKVMCLEMQRMRMKWHKKEAVILGNVGFFLFSRPPNRVIPM